MYRIFTVLIVLLITAGLGLADDLNFKKPSKKEVPYSKTTTVMPYEDAQQDAFPVGEKVSQNGVLGLQKSTATTHHTLIDYSMNGYGWLNSALHPIDRFSGTDFLGDPQDMLLVVYRQKVDGSTETGIIGATEIDVSTGLANASLYRFENVASPSNMGGLGGRYPSAIALDVPFIAFNWYKESAPTGYPGGDVAAISHPYLITDYEQSYGDGMGDWTTPDYIMDDGYLHHDVSENRLWNGPVMVVKDGDDFYRYVAMYANWYSQAEEQIGGLQNDYVVLNGISDSDEPAFDGWVIDTSPYVVDLQEVSYLAPGLDMNSSGFGVIAGPGELGYKAPDDSWFFSDMKITYQITQDYGDTWSDPDTVSFGDLGFPLYHNSEDSLLLYFEIQGEDTVLVSYEGPTFMGTNGDMDVLVTDDNTIFVAFNGLWGRPGDEGWYPSYHYSGTFIARKLDGQPWEAARIWYNNGIFEGDENFEDRSIYFFNSEIDLAMDENGVLYATWLDRRRTDIELGELPRYLNADEGGTVDYKTDIYASHSDNGGADWSEPINVSDTPSLDEYQLKSSRSAGGERAGGTIWLGYSLCSDPSSGTSAEAYVDLENEVWVAEAKDFNPISSIEDDPEVVYDFTLRQNYPNPFNPVTRIEFVPASSGNATLVIYNSAGQVVSEIFNSAVTKGQHYAIDFDGSNLSSGVYFYRLTTRNQTEIRKMILIK